MAIERKYTGTMTEQMEPGEHRVTITDIKFGKSKAGKPMWTITYTNANGAQIKGFYVPEVKFHLRQLKDVKAACGLAETATPDQLMGKRLGIAVEEQEPNQDGAVFMRISGYGKEDLVEDNVQQTKLVMSPTAPKIDDDQEIPF